MTNLYCKLNQIYREALQHSADVMSDIERIRDSYFSRFKEAVDVDSEGEMTDADRLETLNLNDIIKVAPPAVAITSDGSIISLPSNMP